MRVERPIAVAATLAAVLVAGCGSSSRSTNSSPGTTAATTATAAPSTTAAPAITKSAFLARANAVCTASDAELGRAAQQAFGNRQPTPSQWRPFAVAKVVPLVRARVEALRALGSPRGEAGKINAIVDAGLTAVAAARQDPQVLSPSSSAPFDHFNELVSAFGLPACAVGG